MGEQNVREQSQAEEIRVFLRHLLKDVQAFEKMLEEERFETGVRRIGAEQELFLVDKYWRPAPISSHGRSSNASTVSTREAARCGSSGSSSPARRRCSPA